MCSVPMERRMVFGLMPLARRSFSSICECVVDAGWITRDFTSATFASRENSWRDSVNFLAYWASPLSSKVKMDPAPFGKYLS